MILALLITLATVSYTLFDFFASKASGQIDPNASAIIFNGLGALIPLAILALVRLGGSNTLPTTREGMINSVLAGISIAFFSILLIKIFEKGGLAYVIPLIYGGSIILTSLLGWLLLKEKVSSFQLTGILVIALGIGMVVAAKSHTGS
jgi:transporter family protein